MSLIASGTFCLKSQFKPALKQNIFKCKPSGSHSQTTRCLHWRGPTAWLQPASSDFRFPLCVDFILSKSSRWRCLRLEYQEELQPGLVFSVFIKMCSQDWLGEGSKTEQKRKSSRDAQSRTAQLRENQNTALKLRQSTNDPMDFPWPGVWPQQWQCVVFVSCLQFGYWPLLLKCHKGTKSTNRNEGSLFHREECHCHEGQILEPSSEGILSFMGTSKFCSVCKITRKWGR